MLLFSANFSVGSALRSRTEALEFQRTAYHSGNSSKLGLEKNGEAKPHYQIDYRAFFFSDTLYIAL